MKKFILCLVLAVAVSGCGNNFITNPKPLFLEKEIDFGPPEYRAGFHDGCETGLQAYQHSYAKTLYGGPQKTAAYQNNKLYNQVWRDSWNYCYMWLFVQYFDKQAGEDSLL